MDIETQKREFAGLVRQSRRSQGLTQEDLAGRVSITKGALSRYESGDVRVLGEATLRAVCEALQVVGPAWLVGASGEPAARLAEARARARYYCPTPFCALNHAYMLPGRLHFVPQQVESYADAVLLCQWCGADMHPCCTHCRAALVAGGSFCPACGVEYVASVPLDEATRQILDFSPPTVAKLSLPATGVLFWQPRAAAAASGAVGREGDGSR